MGAGDDVSPPRSLLGLRRADAIAAAVTPWLIEGWLVENTLAGLVAASGVGKSFLALDWACCIATGTPWNGFAVKRGPVCFLAGEGLYGLRKRISAWEKHYKVSIAGAPLFLSGGLPYLCNDPNAVASIEEMNQATLAGPSFVVIDTVARAMGGANENSTEDMSFLIRSMDWIRRECRATVLSVHHTGNNPADQGRARGSSAYRAALDSEFLLKSVGSSEIELSASKSKDWSPAVGLRFRKTVVEIEVAEQKETSLVLQPVTTVKVEIDKRPLALEMHASGRSLRQIAEDLEVGKSTVDRWLKLASTPRIQVVPSRPIYTNGGGGTDGPWDKTCGTARDKRDSAEEYHEELG